jgi:hypothetical protein
MTKQTESDTLDEFIIDYEFLKKMFDIANINMNEEPDSVVEFEFRRTVLGMEKQMNTIRKECKILALAYKTESDLRNKKRAELDEWCYGKGKRE